MTDIYTHNDVVYVDGAASDCAWEDYQLADEYMENNPLYDHLRDGIQFVGLNPDVEVEAILLQDFTQISETEVESSDVYTIIRISGKPYAVR